MHASPITYRCARGAELTYTPEDDDNPPPGCEATGPIAQDDENPVALWNRAPRGGSHED